MYRSGHKEKFRMQVTRKAILKYNDMVSRHEEGLHPMYRDASTLLEVEQLNKLGKTNTGWYSADIDTVLKVMGTPGSELKNKILNRIRREQLGEGFKVKVVEKTGEMLSSQISNHQSPWPTAACQRKGCLLCHPDQPLTHGQCRKNNVTYEISYKKCQDADSPSLYWGESGNLAYWRSSLHCGGLERREKQSVLWNHCLQEHNGDPLPPTNFRMKVTSKFANSMYRQISESVQISLGVEQRDQARRERKKYTVMNSLMQFHQPGIIRRAKSKTFAY